MKHFTYATSIFAVLLTLSACQTNTTPEPKQQEVAVISPTDAQGNITPQEMLNRYIDAAKKRDFKSMKPLLTQETIQNLGNLHYEDYITSGEGYRDQPIESAEITLISETPTVKRMSVVFTLNNGKKMDPAQLEFRLENKGWRIHLFSVE